MRKLVGIYGASEEALQLIPLLTENPSVEIGAVYDADAAGLRERLLHFEPDLAAVLEAKLCDDPAALAGDRHLAAVIDASSESDFTTRFPEVAERGVQVVTPLMARLLWGYGATSSDRKSDLLQALHEVVESYNLTIDADELFQRMLEIAISVTGADGGSVMLVDQAAQELRVRVAAGVEPELWPKIRVRIGEGIAGRVAAEARPLRLRGKADRKTFQIVQERLDVESALSVPLIHEGVVLGVLNLHHATRSDAFSESDLAFMEQLAHLDAQIIARAQEHTVMRSQATRYSAARDVSQILSGTAPLHERLTKLCHHVCDRTGRGISSIYLFDPDESNLRLSATSLEGGRLGGEYRIALGQGIDGRVASTREPDFLRDKNGSLAYAALPLVAGNDLAGVLSVQVGHELPVAPFLEDVLAEVASAAADEIQTVSHQARLAERSVKVSAINDTGIRMISTTDPADVLRLGASGAAMALEADHAILRLQDDQTRRYVIRSYFGSADGRQQEKLFRLDRTVSVDAIKRRGPLLVREISESEAYREYECGIRSVMSAPLKRDGHVIGTLSLYDKVIADRFYTGSFSDEDLNMFTKFVSYLERAVVNALFYAKARRHQNYDEDTGLPDASYLKQRTQEEITRAGNRESALTVCTCRVENLQEIEQSSDPARGRLVMQHTAEALKANLRGFDVLSRSSNDEFAILLPEPGSAPGERVFAMARAVADEVAKNDSLNDPVRVALAFGYAVFPSEGEDSDSLMTRARGPRIRMV